MASVSDLPERTVRLLQSSAAFQVDLIFENVHFSGAFFAAVVGAIRRAAAGGRGIGFQVGVEVADAEATYNGGENVIAVPRADYGKDPWERDTLVHECVHAWRDVMGAKVRTTSRGLVSTTYLSDEALAYIVAAMYTAYATTPRGGWVRPPSWASEPVFALAHQIALPLLWTKTTPTVPAGDVRRLKEKIRCHPAYRQMNIRMSTPGLHNGV